MIMSDVSADIETPYAGSVRPFKAALTPSGIVDGRVHTDYLRWLSEGLNGGMDYMRNHLPLRRDPSLVLEGTRTVIALAFPYPDAPQCGIAAYAHGQDYHDAIRRYLTPDIEYLRETLGGDWRLCIDSAPVRERYWAVRSGLASRTLSGNVYVPGLGTRHFLAILLTTLPPETIRPALSRLWGAALRQGASPSTVDEYPRGAVPEGHLYSGALHPLCYKCGACRRACPGHAIHEDGTIDARRCVSYLTIEHRGEWTDPEAREIMQGPGANYLFGCDTCVRSCPLNRTPEPPDCDPEEARIPPILPALRPRSPIADITPAQILSMTREDFSRTFKGSPIKRAKLDGLRRNALNILREKK